MTEYVTFVEINLRDQRKTLVWAVLSVDGRHTLGQIGWYPQWRSYVFVPASSSRIILDWKCLLAISEFCRDNTAHHNREVRFKKENTTP